MYFPPQATACVVALAVLCTTAAPVRAGDWPQWRGPNRNGISEEQLPPQASKNIGGKRAWTAEVGTGFSSIAVAGDHLFTSGHQKGQDTLYCLKAGDGSVVWLSLIHI